MTRLATNRPLRRETAATLRGKPLMIELDTFTLRIRPKGARWSYEVDYESIFALGAKKKAKEAAAGKAGKLRRK